MRLGGKKGEKEKGESSVTMTKRRCRRVRGKGGRLDSEMQGKKETFVGNQINETENSEMQGKGKAYRK